MDRRTRHMQNDDSIKRNHALVRLPVLIALAVLVLLLTGGCGSQESFAPPASPNIPTATPGAPTLLTATVEPTTTAPLTPTGALTPTVPAAVPAGPAPGDRTLDDIPAYPQAEPLSDEQLATSAIGSVRMVEEDFTAQTGMQAAASFSRLPPETTSEAVFSFYEAELSEAGWQRSDIAEDEAAIASWIHLDTTQLLVMQVITAESVEMADTPGDVLSLILTFSTPATLPGDALPEGDTLTPTEELTTSEPLTTSGNELAPAVEEGEAER